MSYGFEPDQIPESFHKVDWWEKHERIPADYGVPEKHHYKDYKLMTPEEEQDYHEKLDEMELDGIEPIY